MRLEDRAAVSDVVIAYATSLDRRDWALLRSLLTDPVEIDYRSFDPALHREMPADEWVRLVTAGLSGFDATQHLSSNHVHGFDGDTARCVSQMHAAHFLQEPAGQSVCILYGYYTSSLVRREAGWRIRKVQLTITARHGDEGVFARATERWQQQEGR